MKRLSTILVAIVLCACSGRDSSKSDSALARDLALANQVQSPPPQFQDTAPSTAMTPAPRSPRISDAPRTRTVPRATAAPTPTTTPIPTATAPAPTPTPSPAYQPAQGAREIGAGAGFALASQQRICTSTNRPGDRFVATVTNPVVGQNGGVVPSGSSVILEVASVAPDGSSITVRPVSVEFNGMSYPINGDVTPQSGLERTRVETDPNADKKKVIGGALAGAIIGQIIGHNTKGTVIGAATGAAGGAVAAKMTEKYQSCLPVGGTMRLTLNSAIVL